MINSIKNLSKNQELLIMLISAFGLFAFFSTRFLIYTFLIDHQGSITTVPNNNSYYFTLIYELLIIFILGHFLKLRDWKIEDFNISFSFKLIGTGILLLMILNVSLNLINLIPLDFSQTDSSIIYQLHIQPSAGIFIIFLSSVIINPAYEELILIGYLGKWFENSNPIAFVITSLLIRLSYHTYQSIPGIIGVVVMGIILSIYYSRYKKLTPVILTHALYNLIFLLYLDKNESP